MQKYKKYILGLIGILGGFSLLSLFLIPILDNKTTMVKPQDKNLESVGDWENTSAAYHYWNAPINSFGIQETKTVNWSFFKQKFNQHTDWLLEYKRYSWSDWTDGNQYLTINKSWNESGFWKINLTFSAPVDVYSARFTFVCDLPVLDYIERDGWSVWLNYSANATENYSVFFNWSDMANIPGVVFTKGVNDNMFWFRFRKDNIPAGTYVFDPWFGDQGEGTGAYLLLDTDDIFTGRFYNSGTGTADNITAYCAYVVSGPPCRALLYDSSYNFVGQTDEVTIKSTTTYWETFNFSGSKPSITPGWYYIGIHGDCGGGARYSFKLNTSGGDGTIRDNDNGNHYSNYPATLTNDTWNIDDLAHIYCSYTEGGAESWQMIDNSINGTAYNTTTWQTIDYSINGSCFNTTTWQTIDFSINGTCTNTTDTITFNFINQTPNNIRINNTGYATITYNLTTGWTGLNQTSLMIVHVLNNTRNLHLNNTYTLYAENWVPDKKCAINRNYPYWFETELSTLTGDGTIGDIGEWAIHNTTLYENITINSQGDYWINFTQTIPILENLFGNIFLVNHEAITIENKSTQGFDVYKDNAVKVSFNMTNTQWYNDTEYNNTYYTLHFYADPTIPDEDLLVYFANESYTSGNPLTSEYCELIGTIEVGEPYEYTILNSSYHDISFSTDTNGNVGNLAMTEVFSFIFASNSKDDTHKWVIHYADDNITIIEEYHNFNNTLISETCADKGKTWVTRNGTVDTFLTYGHLEGIDRIMYKVYCQMNGTATGDGQWSSIQIDILDESNVPPNIANIITPNGTAPTVDYTVGDIINVTYSWLGDPNLDTCWLNITATNTTHSISHYIQNRSITAAEYEVNNTWWYNWDTTGLSPNGEYRINITVTDPYDLSRTSEQQGVFWLNATVQSWQTIDFSINGTAYNTTTWIEIDSTINGTAWNDSETWNNIDYSINGTAFNTSVPVELTITNENPSNGSSIPYTYPTIYFTINSTTGLNMNYTVYWNTSLDETIATATGQTNGTYYHAFTNASSIGVTYNWSVNLTDTDGNWLNESYSFTTRNETSGGMGRSPLGVILLFGITPFVLIFLWKRKKRKEVY